MNMEQTIAHVLAKGEQRTSDVATGSTTFEQLQLNPSILKVLREHKFLTPTKIQAAAIPMALAGMDLLVQSKSGTGKTLIYLLAALQTLNKSLAKPQVLIIVPTRELAIQVEDTSNGLSCHMRSNASYAAVSYIGGTDVKKDRMRMSKARIVVGTPGRLLHLLHNNVFNTSSIKLIVLDEADQLYATETLQKDVQAVLEAMPKFCQLIACSATYPNQLDERLSKVMHNPILISNSERATVLLGIRQFVYELPEQLNSLQEMMAKLGVLRQIFDQLPYEQGILFASSQSRADSYRNYLQRNGVACDLMSGAMQQSKRLETFQAYRNFKTRTMVATDLMARGVDSSHANLVINLDPPKDLVTYLHRIGRAGRFGSKGIAITFISSPQQCQHFKRIVAEAGTGMSVLQFPTEQRADFNFWDFDSYDFPYFQKLEAHEQAEDELKRIKQRWKTSPVQSDPEADLQVKKDSVLKSVVDIRYLQKTIQNIVQTNEKHSEPKAINVVNESQGAEAVENEGQKNNEISLTKVIIEEPQKTTAAMDASTYDQNMQPTNEKKMENNQILSPTEAIIFFEEIEKITSALDGIIYGKNKAYENEGLSPPKDITSVEESQTAVEIKQKENDEISPIKGDQIVKKPQTAVHIDTIKCVENMPEKNEQISPTEDVKIVESQAAALVENKPERHEQQIPNEDSKNLITIESAEKQHKSSVESTLSVDFPAAAPNSINTKTYLLMPDERSSTTLIPLGISNTVDDASSIISDSMENDYDSDASYISTYSMSDARIIWRRMIWQRKFQKRFRKIKRSSRYTNWQRKQKSKKQNKWEQSKINSKQEEEDDDVSTLTENQNKQPNVKFAEKGFEVNVNNCRQIVNRFHCARLLSKFDNWSRQRLSSLFEGTDYNLRKSDKCMEELYNAMKHIYYVDHTKPKLSYKSILPVLSGLNSHSRVNPRSDPMPRMESRVDDKLQLLDRLSVHVNHQINILPVVVAPDLENVEEMESDISDSEVETESDDNVEPYSSGFVESTESASSGIDTSVYGSDSSTEMNSEDEEEDDSDNEYDYDDEENEDEDDEEGEDEDDEEEEGESDDDEDDSEIEDSAEESTSTDKDETDPELENEVATDQERWKALFEMQYQFISNYVHNYMETYSNQ
ncbi:probable ATP-dependent RNA helicase DDX10 isoform X1 [Drosophila sulfurigaster albostrigata]|uniref:probable ATP-dependent RNA helicase DDX10 isoform X1 n=1 Tax=Drosophila sulfurigaster albostrigata TaxID=89887 RepID=UPI002D21AAB5|nr:probable ATP-dependent RNA helicase DDX10 isoform X1 [Drosophila sulfurigaster albostrigata]